MNSSRLLLLALLSAAPIITMTGCKCSPPEPFHRSPAESASHSPNILPPRCARAGQDLAVGENSSHIDKDQLDKVLPFATEFGKAVHYADGFASTFLRQAPRGTEAVLALGDDDGTHWSLVSLGPIHGDAEPPVVFARKATVGIALLEPSGASRTLRIGRLSGNDVQWGGEGLLQGLDDSLAFDAALGPNSGVAVWDDTDDKNDVSAIYAATFSIQKLAFTSKRIIVTTPGTNADQPRIAVTEGGYWVTWMAHRPAPAPRDKAYHAEDLSYRWLEVAKIDSTGRVVAEAQRLGPDTGHVLGYDMAAAKDGSLVVSWLDNDAPPGSSGGTLWLATVDAGGVHPPVQLDLPDIEPMGAPRLLGKWLSLSDRHGKTWLGPWTTTGVSQKQFRLEPAFGAGQPVVNAKGHMLVVRPAGLSNLLYMVRCTKNSKQQPSHAAASASANVTSSAPHPSDSGTH